MKDSSSIKKLIVNDFMKYLLGHIMIVFFGGIIHSSCTPKPYAASNKVYKQKAKAFSKILSTIPKNPVEDSLGSKAGWIGTVNFGLRKPNFVIIHHTAQNSCDLTLKTFTTDSSQVSAHYVICKDGTLHHLLNDYLRAWHAGVASWGNTTDINSVSVGVELDNNGTDSFSEPQLHSLELLLGQLKKDYNIPTLNFIGHADIAPGRKVDPSVYFPWKRFADLGYGMWYSDTTNIVVPENFNEKIALRLIGYNTSNLLAAVQTFRLHFLQSLITGPLSEAEKKVLYVLMLQNL